MHRDLQMLERGGRPKKARGKFMLLALLIGALMAAGVWFWSERAQTSTGLHLQTTIRTDPPGALVILGDHAQKTPATFEDLEPRKYNLRIMSPGYEPIETAIDLSARRAPALPPFHLVRS